MSSHRTSHPDEQDPWYSEGLQFECTRCGKCCGGEPGYVWVDSAEIVALAARFEMSAKTFKKEYTRRARKGRWRGVTLLEKENYDCIFWENGSGCTVYEDRPRQCRTYPFWRRVLASPQTWRDESEECPGMDRGPVRDLVQITTAVRNDGLPPD